MLLLADVACWLELT